MKLTEKLKNLLEADLTDFDYDAIASLLANDELSTDDEMVDLLNAETDSDINKKDLAILIKKERENFKNKKYKGESSSRAIIKKYLG